MADQFDGIIAQMASERAMSAFSLDHPAPDAAGQANILARQTGLPAETVDRNLADLQRETQKARAKLLVERYPPTSAWLSEPRNAAVAADDVPNLTANAEHWQSVAAGPVRYADGTTGPVTSRATMAAPAGAPTTFMGSLAGWGTAFVESARQQGIGLQKIAADYLPDINLSRPGVPQLGNYGSQNATTDHLRSEARIDATTPAFKSNLWRGLYGGVSSLVQMVPGIAASVATGSPVPTLAAAGLQQGLPAYSKYRARGATPGMAAVGGAAEGAIEVGTEMLPMGFLVDSIGKLGKVGTSHFIKGYLGRELPSEIAATLGQNAVDTAIANPDKTWGQYIAEQPDAIVQTALGTLVATGAFAGVNHVAKHFAAVDEQNAATADSAQALDRAMTAAADSKVRQRDPEAFKQFVAAHTEGTPGEHVYVAADRGRAYFEALEGEA